MAARATSSGTISFGLVSIPIKVYTATQSKSVRFNMLHDTDKARLKQQYVCSTCGEVVERTATIKGYEYARNQYVVMAEEELKSIERKSDGAIEIEEFIPIEKVDPIYFEKSNLLGPDKGGQKAYRLLQQTMKSSEKVALGRFSTRGRQRLVLLRASGEGLLMHGLFYADEVRSFDDIEFGDAVELKDGELKLAHQLIDQLSTDSFDPEKYEDEYRQTLLSAVERKVAGEEIINLAPTQEPEQIIDLVAALKKSLSERDADGSRVPRVRKAAKAKGSKSDGKARKTAAR